MTGLTCIPLGQRSVNRQRIAGKQLLERNRTPTVGSRDRDGAASRIRQIWRAATRVLRHRGTVNDAKTAAGKATGPLRSSCPVQPIERHVVAPVYAREASPA